MSADEAAKYGLIDKVLLVLGRRTGAPRED
jgi:ATP-dependent protease ClpP protease subunit